MREVQKHVGSYSGKRIALLLRDNGLGDDIHSLPAIWQKIQSGYEVHVIGTGGRRTQYLFESVGCICWEYETIGFVEKHLGHYEAIYALSEWCITFEQTHDELIDRMAQFAGYIDSSLPKEFNYASFLTPGVSKREGKLLCTRSGSSRRSYRDELNLLVESSYEFMDKVIPIKDLCYKIFHAEHVIAVDTGVLALALALGTPCLGIFGPTDEHSILGQFSRYRDMRTVAAVRSDRDDTCQRPCNFLLSRGWEDRCKTSADCLNELTPRQILNAIHQ